MAQSTPLFVGLDVHTDSIAVAHAAGGSTAPPVFVGLVPSEYSSGSSRRQGGITKTGNGRARRALIEAAWAYRHPAKVSAHIQTRIDALPTPLQDMGWKAQVRLCKRFRRLTTRGKHPNVVVTAIARELIAFMWAIAKEVPLAA